LKILRPHFPAGTASLLAVEILNHFRSCIIYRSPTAVLSLLPLTLLVALVNISLPVRIEIRGPGSACTGCVRAWIIVAVCRPCAGAIWPRIIETSTAAIGFGTVIGIPVTAAARNRAGSHAIPVSVNIIGMIDPDIIPNIK
jgi:hypothetical protein